MARKTLLSELLTVAASGQLSAVRAQGGMFMPTDLENRFHDAMLDVYQRAKAEAGYNASRFLSMVAEQGGYEAARTLLHASNVSDGYTALWQRKRLDLTVEAVILKHEWRDLFSEFERDIARQRLAEYGYDPGPIGG